MQRIESFPLSNRKWLAFRLPDSAVACARYACLSFPKAGASAAVARVITCTVAMRVNETDIHLLTIYDKSERESISKSELRPLLEKNDLL